MIECSFEPKNPSLAGSQHKKRKKRSEGSGVDYPRKKSAREDREERLKEAMEALKTKHGGSYTEMQDHIWSEVYAHQPRQTTKQLHVQQSRFQHT